MALVSDEDAFEPVPPELMERVLALLGEGTERELKGMVVIVFDVHGHPGLFGLWTEDTAAQAHAMTPHHIYDVLNQLCEGWRANGRW